jgi:hypothetical protein
MIVSETCVSFSIPKACPTSSPLICSLKQQEVVHDDDIPSAAKNAALVSPAVLATNASPSAETPEASILSEVVTNASSGSKRKLSKAPLMVSEVRRSERIKKNQQGFKT